MHSSCKHLMWIGLHATCALMFALAFGQACRKCPSNTFNANTRSTASAECLSCPSGAETGGKIGQTSSLACTCPIRTYLAEGISGEPIRPNQALLCVCLSVSCFQHSLSFPPYHSSSPLPLTLISTIALIVPHIPPSTPPVYHDLSLASSLSNRTPSSVLLYRSSFLSSPPPLSNTRLAII